MGAELLHEIIECLVEGTLLGLEFHLRLVAGSMCFVETDLHTLVVKERQQQLEADAHTLTAQRQQLRDLWAGMDLEDDLEQMLDQALLTDAERERLTEMLEALDRSAHTAVARVDLTQRALQDHQENRPEGLNLETFALEHERLALGTLREELEATMREALRIQGIIERQEERARTLTALQQRLDRARQDHAIAYEIHKLIGVNDGDSFRQYAQILNLQELIDRANVRLRWLNPRYALVTGLDKDEQPRLGFAVRDSHYAQVERPLTTLSGGETFIVSLALALGLADFRTIDMPIETLLLDEGLGTLDSEVLNTVMGALERLHGGGTQIGIISHVEALKERVEARIVLEKQGGGRSWLRFEMGDGT
ncbi:MAG: SbcC/MukB-like Walker B domain-containing protein [Myxococcota bacterium]